jgi:hypothetical protein
MTAFVEQIMQQFETYLTGLATTGSNVFRDDSYNISKDEIVAINVNQGTCIKINDLSSDISDWELTVNTVAIAKEVINGEVVTKASTIANQICQEMVVAMNLLAFPNLGLSFVQRVEEGDYGEMVTDHQEVSISGLQISWSVQFRRSISNPGA